MKFYHGIIYFLSLALGSMSGMVFHDVSENDIFCPGHKCTRATIERTDGCRCDAYCSVLHDCCGDSKYLEMIAKHPYVSCQSFPNSGDVYLINGCRSTWTGSKAIRNNCTQNSVLNSDPLGNVPVISLRTNITYKNYYCAVCNNDTQSISSWKIGLNCSQDVSETFLRENLVFESSYNKWGFWSGGRRKFNQCDLTFYAPKSHEDIIRFCDRKEISSCPRRYRNDTVKYKCHSYRDPVNKDSVRYRNTYCALCNGINDALICLGIGGKRGIDSPGINFALLMDFDFSQGNCVGGISDANCACGEVYDVYSKRCRQIVCGLPGMRLVNGRCVSG